jgi:hypothetical protein
MMSSAISTYRPSQWPARLKTAIFMADGGLAPASLKTVFYASMRRQASGCGTSSWFITDCGIGMRPLARTCWTSWWTAA